MKSLITLSYFEREDAAFSDIMRGDLALTEILRLLRDGKWHNREDLVLDAMKVIPPGKALRLAEYRRLESYRKTLRDRGFTPEEIEEQIQNEGPQNTPRAMSRERMIRSGRRYYITSALNGTVRLEHKKDEHGVQWVRRVPLSSKYTQSVPAQARMNVVDGVLQILSERITNN